MGFFFYRTGFSWTVLYMYPYVLLVIEVKCHFCRIINSAITMLISVPLISNYDNTCHAQWTVYNGVIVPRQEFFLLFSGRSSGE